MNKENIEKRRGQLISQRTQLSQEISTLAANLSAFNGAIEECDFWLREIESLEGNTNNSELA